MRSPEPVLVPLAAMGGVMLWIAVAGLAVNILAFWILTRGEGENLNVRAAALHVAGDLLGSVAAIVAALVILWTGWTPIDPILSVLVVLIILRSAWKVVRESGHMLLEGAPQGFDPREVVADLTQRIPGVVRVHHVHARSITQKRPMVTLEAEVAPDAELEAARHAIKARLLTRFGMGHATVEVQRMRPPPNHTHLELLLDPAVDRQMDGVAAMAKQDGTTPLVPSDEGDKKGLEFGRAQGEALSRTLRHMTDEIAHDGREVQSGEYLVAYAVEEAEGMWVPKGGELEWTEPEDENAHIEVAVRDAADGRLIPGLKVEATVIGGDGKEIGTHELPFLWHPYLYHYGRNWTLPANGPYTLKVRFDAPDFARHDEKNGRRFLKGAEVTFDNVKVERGQD